MADEGEESVSVDRSEGMNETRKRFLRAAYDKSINEPGL
jgi:hypothetical protein